MAVSCSAGSAAISAANAVSTSHGVGQLMAGPTNFHQLVEEGANLVDIFSYSSSNAQTSNLGGLSVTQKAQINRTQVANQGSSALTKKAIAKPVTNASVVGKPVTPSLSKTVVEKPSTVPSQVCPAKEDIPDPTLMPIVSQNPTKAATQTKLVVKPVSGQVPSTFLQKGKKITVKRLLDEGQTTIPLSAITTPPSKKLSVSGSGSLQLKQLTVKKSPQIPVTKQLNTPVSASNTIMVQKSAQVTPVSVAAAKQEITRTPVISLHELPSLMTTISSTVVSNTPNQGVVTNSNHISKVTSNVVQTPTANSNQLKSVKVCLQDPTQTHSSPSMSTPTIVIQGAEKSSANTSNCLTPSVAQNNSSQNGSPSQSCLAASGQQKQGKSKRRGCRCGLATPNPGKLTCCGQRCPCYVDGKGCFDCKCRGCRNPHRANTNSGISVAPAVKVVRMSSSKSNNAQTITTTNSNQLQSTTSMANTVCLTQGSFPGVTAVNLISVGLSQVNNQGIFLGPNLTLAPTTSSSNNSFCFTGNSLPNTLTTESPTDHLTLPLLDDMTSSIANDNDLTKLSYSLMTSNDV